MSCECYTCDIACDKAVLFPALLVVDGKTVKFRATP